MKKYFKNSIITLIRRKDAVLSQKTAQKQKKEIFVMKTPFFTAVFLFISAYSPLFLIISIKDFDFGLIYGFKHPGIVCIMLFIVFSSIVLLFTTLKYIKKGNMPVIIKSINLRSEDLISYSIPYMLPFLGFDISKKEDVISLGLFLTIMFIMTSKSKTIFINPILLIAGYNLYNLEYEFDGKTHSTIALSKFDIQINEIYYIRCLTRFIYLIHSKKGEYNGR